MKNSIKDALNNKYRTLRMMQRVCSTKQEPVIDMCVNLRIVERESVQQNESDFVKANEYSSRTQQIVDFDKLSPIKFTHCADINIEQIFDNVKTTKVAIYGRAGIGKSTLCQYISVKWQEGNLWSDKFNAVFWLPLRDIVGYQSEEEEVQRYLADIVRNRCIAGFDTEKPTVLNIAEYIFAPENAGKILVILDGYDEVAHSMPKKLQDLLRMILESERFCSILTSRPVAITLSNKAVTFDQELENVGFAQKNIKTYIKKFYPKDSKKLRDLIESNSSLRNIAYIPLNLELICSVWASSPNLQQNCTLTQLYQEVIELMGKRMYEKPVFASNTERKAVVLELLSEIALLGMTERKSILDPKKVQAIINKKENELNIQNLFEEVLAFGVLKIAMINKDLRENPLSFIHHTFQEHFASLNMVKAFEQYHVDEVDHESLAMLKSVKYDPYYEKMLISVVGLLYANCNISGNYLPLFYFWDIFENEPRELLGNKHDTLKALLQNECPTITNPPAALSKLNSSLINLERMLDNIFHTIENGANLEKCNAIEVLINLNITDQDLLESVATRLEKLVLKYSVKIQDMKIDENDLIKLTVYLAYGLLSLGANSKAALDILCKSYYYCTTGMRAPKIGDSPKREYNKDYALYQAEALQRLRANNNVNTEIKRKLEKRLIQHQSKRIELIGWFGQNDDNSSNIVGISYMAGLVGGLVVINPATPFALLMVGGVTIASGMSARCITQSSLYQYYFQSTRNLDTIYKSSDADRLKLICEKVNNSERIVLRWAREGMLDLLSAIQLYSYSKQSIWLAPMKNIVFLYKDPSLIFTIQNKLIKNSNTTLTSTAHQTQAVLAAMKEGYIKANLDTKVLDHYINGASLDISGKEEKDAMTKAKIALLRKRNGLKPMSFTQLHKAAASGNLDEVKRIVGEGMIDINDFQNDAWETPLVVAIKHKHWPIVEYLVEQGADVNIGGAMADAPACLDMSPELLKLMFERSITVNNDLLRKMLLCTIEDYKLQHTTQEASFISNRLIKAMIGKRPMLEYGIEADKYKMMINNIGSISRDGNLKLSPTGNEAFRVLYFRLQIYIKLYIQLSTDMRSASFNTSKFNHRSLDTDLESLYMEIRSAYETFINNWVFSNFEGVDISPLRESYSNHVIEHLKNIPINQEYVIATASSEGTIGHCLYIALHKYSESEILIRVDNKWLTANCLDSQIHNKHPYVIKCNELNETNQIKSYCLALFNLAQDSDRKILASYIEKLFVIDSNSRKLAHVYGRDLPDKVKLTYGTMPYLIKTYVDSWPYHYMQAAETNNCTLSSYSLGIANRHGMEFFEWLMSKEESLLPPMTTISHHYRTANQTHTAINTK